MRSFFILTIFFCLPVFAAEPIVAYITDVEGSRKRLESFLNQSEAFQLGTDGRVHLKKNAYFIFGGDAPDRYLGSQWVVAELVRLKKESPDRVILILGNRDINKMRINSELTPAALQMPAVKFHSTKQDEWQKHMEPESASERLKFIFSYTMGAPQAFELRRTEIASDAEVPSSQISDEVVADSFLKEMGPQGNFRQLLELGQLAFRIENTLFLHGGITKENFGSVPLDSNKYQNVDEWIVKLNQWFQSGVEIWKEQAPRWTGVGPKAEQEWLDYPMPRPGALSRPDSVVTGRNSDLRNNPQLPAPEVIQQLSRQGIERIVVGHTPTGDYMTLLRTLNDRFEVISADNSYAKSEEFVSFVHFKGAQLKETSIRGRILLDQVEEVASNLTIGVATSLGKRLKDGGLILGWLVADPHTYVSFQYGDQFKILNKLISEKDIVSSQLLEPTSDTECSRLFH